MAKVTSKLQITLPKALATQYGIAPGDEIEFSAAGHGIRLTPKKAPQPQLSHAERLRIWEHAKQAMEAHWQRVGCPPAPQADASGNTDRGWTRDELYDRVTRYDDPAPADAQSVKEDGADHES